MPRRCSIFSIKDRCWKYAGHDKGYVNTANFDLYQTLTRTRPFSEKTRMRAVTTTTKKYFLLTIRQLKNKTIHDVIADNIGNRMKYRQYALEDD